MSAISPKPQPPAQSPPSTAPKIARLFKNGRSQAVRLPKEFRFEGEKVAIRRNPTTGEVILSSIADRQSTSWKNRFTVWDALGSPEDDVLERDQSPAIERDFF
ncbi:MAG TPA: AbrB/MazE/SpoVT family DNA-binding domain-containing protein [Terracidiphilus sp.]|jgi:antitoxin VapB